MLLAKFIEGFIFGIKKTNRLDDNDNVSGGKELLILADQVSIKEVEEQLKQAPVLREQNGSNENEAEDVVIRDPEKVEDVVNRDPEKSLEKETSEKAGGEQTRWWLGGTEKEEEQEGVKEVEQEEEQQEEKTEEEEQQEEVEQQQEKTKEEEEESSRKDLLDLANNFYQKAHMENQDKVKTVEYVPYDAKTFPKGHKNTTILDEVVTIDTIDVVDGKKIEETERMEADQIVDKVKISIVEFDKEREENLNNNKETGFDEEKEENLILLNTNNKGTEFNKDREENLMLVSSSNKGTGLFEEVDLTPAIIKEANDGKTEEIEKAIKDEGIVETEDIGMFDKVSVTVNVEPVETKDEFQDDKEKEKLIMTEKEKEKNLIKSEAELEDEMLTDWFQKMEDALNGVKTRRNQW